MRPLPVMVMLAFAAIGTASAAPIVHDGPILSLLGKVEGPDGYDEISGHSKLQPPKPISSMRIEEVIAFQDRMVAAGSASSAVGRYQFIRKTLRDLVARHRVDRRQMFNARTQDFLARMLLNDCNYYDPDADTTRIGNCVATIWAAFPVFTGPKAGKSHYHGIAGNRAQTTVPVMRAIIGSRSRPPVDLRQAGLRTPRQVVWPDDGRVADPVPLR